MNTKNRTKSWIGRATAFTALTAIVGVPFLNAPQAAQADDDHRWNRRDRDRDRDRDGRWDRDERERWEQRRRWENRNRNNNNNDWRYRNNNNDYRYRNGSGYRNGNGYNNGYGYGSDISFNGTVVGGNYQSRLIVRADNGRTYTVSGGNDFDRRINVGDRVRIEGRGNGNSIYAERATLIDNRR